MAHGNTTYNIFVFLDDMHRSEIFLFSIFKCCSFQLKMCLASEFKFINDMTHTFSAAYQVEK